MRRREANGRATAYLSRSCREMHGTICLSLAVLLLGCMPSCEQATRIGNSYTKVQMDGKFIPHRTSAAAVLSTEALNHRLHHRFDCSTPRICCKRLRGGSGDEVEQSTQVQAQAGSSQIERVRERKTDSGKENMSVSDGGDGRREVLARPRTSSAGSAERKRAGNSTTGQRFAGLRSRTSASMKNASLSSPSLLAKRKGRPRMSRAHSEVTFPSMDSYAYSERTDLGFSLFLDRRCKIVYFIGNAEGLHNLVEPFELLVCTTCWCTCFTGHYYD